MDNKQHDGRANELNNKKTHFTRLGQNAINIWKCVFIWKKKLVHCRHFLYFGSWFAWCVSSFICSSELKYVCVNVRTCVCFILFVARCRHMCVSSFFLRIRCYICWRPLHGIYARFHGAQVFCTHALNPICKTKHIQIVFIKKWTVAACGCSFFIRYYKKKSWISFNRWNSK